MRWHRRVIDISHMTNQDGLGLVRWIARGCAILTIAVPLGAFAQTSEPPANAAEPPPASTGAGWTTESETGAQADQQNVELGDRAPIVLTTEQLQLLGRINGYLNSLINLQGRFVQTDHRNEETHGRFYLRRPGKLRFDYSSPSMMRIVSDGEYLSVEDHDLKTVDKFPLNATPIQMLLSEDVNLTRDAVILDMRQDDSAVVVVIKDKSGNSPGHLQLFFKRPELELYEWVITDAQGLDTRIQLADLVRGKEKSEDFFKSSAIELDNLDNN
jgi:outer membrane lipoprotein-sorting protein